MKNDYLLPARFYFVISVLLLVVFCVASVTFAQVSYPIRELGGCKNFEDCQRYCYSSQSRLQKCIDYLKVHNLSTDGATEPILQDPNNYPDIPEATAGKTTTTVGTPVISVPNASALSGTVSLYVKVSGGAEAVYVYLLRRDALLATFSGTARSIENDEWLLSFDTQKFENGEYTLRAQAKKGTSVSGSDKAVNIANVSGSALPSKITETQEVLESISGESNTLIESTVTQIESAVEQVLKEEAATDEAKNALDEFDRLLELHKARLLSSVDAADTTLSEQFNREVEGILRDISLDLSVKEGEALSKEVDKVVTQFENSVRDIKKTFDERVGPAVFRDSDKDNLSDYDEAHIIGTDPVRNDTDGDGKNDGEELLSGFNPSNPSPEARLSYEDAETSGAEVSSAFSVDSIAVTATKKDSKGKETASKIELRGRALANSIVTLHIYSAPIVVTTKADGEGRWVYTLDQELPDGGHKVYVAIVDTGGKIVAKSAPVPFVKQAAAVELGQTGPVTTEGPELLGINGIGILVAVIFIVFLVAILAIGVIHRRHKHEDVPPTAPPSSPPPPTAAPNA